MVNICITGSYDILDPTCGGGARVRGLIKGLSKASEINKIVVVCPFARAFHGKNISSYIYFSHRNFNFLKAYHKVGIVDEINPFRNKTLMKIIRKFNVDILQNESIWGGLSLAAVSKYCHTPLVIDEHNFEAEYTKAVKRSATIQLYSRWLESNVLKLAQHLLTVSEEDKRNISRVYGISSHKTTVIPNGVDFARFNPSDFRKTKMRSELRLNDKFVLVFHGSLDYGPNREAVTKIIDFILPQLQRIVPNSFFLIVGRNPPQFNYDNRLLKFTGFVPNLNDYLAACDLAIVPIQTGGGTKMKLLDYLAMGMPIVATRKAVEGLPVENNVHALLSDEVDEKFIENVLTLYNDVELKQKLSKNCRNLAKRYDWSVISNELVKVYRGILA
jgi:glycosyltransferase involved in cell wall biosynthesis